MGLDFQDLGKSRMTSAIRFQGVFHGPVIIARTDADVNCSNGLVQWDDPSRKRCVPSPK